MSERLISTCSKVAAALVLVLGAAAAHAVSANWWIDLANDRVESVKTELALGEDPNVRTKEGQPAIMEAIKNGAWGVYDLLSRHRALNVNITNAHNETPLMYLALLGDVDRARQLIKRGAKVNRLGWTPLHYAASKGQAKMVSFLISQGALVDAPSPDGTTPLMMAAYSGSEDTVRVLLKAGAEPTTVDLKQLDAAGWAQKNGYSELAAQLKDLIDRKLAQRRSREAGDVNNGIPAASEAAAPVSGAPSATVNGTAASDVETQGANRAAAGNKLLDEPKSDEGNSTSRYFDLERFDQGNPRY